MCEDVDVIQVNNVFINKTQIRDILPEINDYEATISLSDIGNRGNFELTNNKTGKIIVFKNGKRI